jgi:hypothetical protein
VSQYPFVLPFEKTVAIVHEEEIKFSNFLFEYRKEVDFPILETFVQSSMFSSVDTIDGAPLVLSQDIGGKAIGKILLNDSLKYCDIATKLITFRPYGSRFFWEISYKCDGRITTYIRFASGTPQDLGIFPSTKGEWKKGYIDITEILRLGAGMTDQVSLSLGIRGNRTKDATDAYFYFEYIKLVSMVAPY